MSKIVILQLIMIVAMIVIAALIFRAIWNSNLPMWLKIFLLKGA